MPLGAAGGRDVPALPQWDGAFPHARRLVALAVEVLEAHDAFDGGAVQHKPTPVPFLQKEKCVIIQKLDPHNIISYGLHYSITHASDLYKPLDG